MDCKLSEKKKQPAGQLSTSLPRLLLVDDEPDILAVCNMSLSESFDIMTSSGPRETLDHFKSHSSTYDLMLTDIRMLTQAQMIKEGFASLSEKEQLRVIHSIYPNVSELEQILTNLLLKEQLTKTPQSPYLKAKPLQN